MPDGLEQAAQAFDAVISSSPDKTTKTPGKAPASSEGPPETVFARVGELDADSEPRGGGDTDDDEEEIKNAPKPPKKAEDDSGDADETDGGDSDGDDDESDGDDAERDKDASAGDGDEEESEEDSAVLAKKVEVTVDGEPVEVTVKEALEGYVRTETFHRRMNQLDEAKKVVRRAAADAVQNYEYSMNLAKQMEAHMDTMIPKEPDWDQEFQKDAQKARELQRYYEKANAFRAELRRSMDEAAKKQHDSNMAQTAAFAEEEGAKFEQMNRKNWSDPKKKAKDLHSMRKTGLSAGFTEDELSQVYDSRMLMVLLKASKYDRMMAAKPKPIVRPNGKPIPPGAGNVRQRTAQKGATSAMKRLNRTGSVEDAAVVFDHIIARS